MKSWGATKAAYRLLSDEAIQYEDVIEPHWKQTRQASRSQSVVLMVQDLTSLNYSAYPSIQGLGPIGDNKGQGLHMSSVLAILPTTRQILGMAYQLPFIRQMHNQHETRTQRAKRSKESDVWMKAVCAIGPCPPEVCWVHVGDRGADISAFFDACRQQNCAFLVRVNQNRRMYTPTGELTYLKTFAAHQPSVSEQILDLPAEHGLPARQANLHLSFSSLLLLPGWMNRKQPALSVWVVRVWEVNPPDWVEEPIEWILLTSVPTESVDQAWERVAWYRCRWLVEDFHQCLKTGCQIEHRRLKESTSLLRLLAILTPLAVELLQMRQLARLEPDSPAAKRLPADLVQVVASLTKHSATDMTMSDFWRSVAQLGGYLGRKHDGLPGWKSLWEGWLYVQNLLKGFRLASGSGWP
jgi:hypothetical protein